MSSVDQPPGDREIYPSAPLRLVAAEIRYPFSPRLSSLDPATALERLEDLVPMVSSEETTLQLMVGPAGKDMQSVPFPSPRLLRLLAKDRTLAVTLTGTNAIVETTNYSRFEAFKDIIERVLVLLEEVGPPVAVERLGLRYIDEIKVASVTDPPGNWRGLVHDSLIDSVEVTTAAVAGAGLEPQNWQSITNLVSSGQEGFGLTVRYGAGLGQVVNPAGVLRFPGESDEAPAFLIDIDSYWAPAEVDDFSIPSLLARCGVLHMPLREVFEGLITDRLRDEVLRVPKEEEETDA